LTFGRGLGVRRIHSLVDEPFCAALNVERQFVIDIALNPSMPK
jgi:hypothetical protein